MQRICHTIEPESFSLITYDEKKPARENLAHNRDFLLWVLFVPMHDGIVHRFRERHHELVHLDLIQMDAAIHLLQEPLYPAHSLQGAGKGQVIDDLFCCHW